MRHTALVTGGTKGVGLGIVRRLVDDGWSVLACARSSTDDLPDGVAFESCDVRDPEAVAGLVRTTVDQLGSLDLAVNNAGGAPAADAATASPRFSEAIVRLNLLGPLHVAQAANAVMQQQDGGGVIVNIGSVSALRPSPGAAAYGAAKAGLVSLTATLAVEWGPKVRVVCVTAGLVETEQSGLHYGDSLATVAATVPAGRLGMPADVAAAVAWVASAEASYLSGSNLVLHGGGERPAYLGAVRA